MGPKDPERQVKSTADGVVAGLGIEPNLDLARMAGLQTAEGIVVDERLRTSQPDIYSAGDVALFYNPALWTGVCEWSTKTTPTRWAGWPAGTWPGARSAI